ncbi:MAG: hypothetical protein ACK4GL_04755 [Flavobacteriales bacterium]
MKRFYTLIITVLMAFSGLKISAQEAILDQMGKLFKKEERKPMPKIKSKYFFEISENTGREYLKQQDLFDAKGGIKSSGLFADDGNKIRDIRYIYTPEGIVQQKTEKILGGGDRIVSTYSAKGLIERTEIFNDKGDSLKSKIVFTYNADGAISEEAISDASGNIQEKKVYENTFNKSGKPVQILVYNVDKSGNRVPHNAPLTINEYDEYDRIIQTTVYSNKERRKMLSWIYYKYQVDNSYRVIKRYGYDEEQREIARVEIEYRANGLEYQFYEMCDCPERKLEFKGKLIQEYNTFGELVKEQSFTANGDLKETITFAYDEYGNLIEKLCTDGKDPSKIKKDRFIFEFFTEQAKK